MLNRYFPPDFDPALVPKRTNRKNLKCEVRMMLPMTVQCVKCGEYMYRGKKYTARTEYLEDETYLGIKKVRFYGKCCVCSNAFTIKTDPENEDYEVESGVTRNFESWKLVAAEKKAAQKEREQLEFGDPMKALEHRTIESKREMDALDDLDALKALSSHMENADTVAIIAHRIAEAKKSRQVAATEEDKSQLEAFRLMRREQRLGKSGTTLPIPAAAPESATPSSMLETVTGPQDASDLRSIVAATVSSLKGSGKRDLDPTPRITLRRKRRKPAAAVASIPRPTLSIAPAPTGLGLGLGYSSSSASESP